MSAQEIQNQLKSQDLQTVSPSAFAQVGNPIFPDSSTVEGLQVLRHVVLSWASVHAPTYGHPIPQSGAVETVTGTSGTLLSLDNNATALIQRIECESVGGSIVTISVGGLVQTEFAVAPATASNALDGKQLFTIDTNQDLTFTATETTTVKVGYALTVQG